VNECRTQVRRVSVALLLVFVGVGPIAAATLEVTPVPLVEHGPLEVRLAGPFLQPAPTIQIHIEGAEIIVRTYSQDFGYPDRPPVAAVSATTTAPAAGIYELVDLRCAGNPPPPAPGCIVAERRTIEVGPVPPIPSTGFASLAALALGCLGFARQTLRRARA
jgi:hypothetical protein